MYTFAGLQMAKATDGQGHASWPGDSFKKWKLTLKVAKTLHSFQQDLIAVCTTHLNVREQRGLGFRVNRGK